MENKIESFGFILPKSAKEIVDNCFKEDLSLEETIAILSYCYNQAQLLINVLQDGK